MAQPASAALSRPPRRIRGQDLDRQQVGREAADRQGNSGLAAHRVHVGESVGGGDGAEGLRVIDDGRDEVHGEHQRRAVFGAQEGRILHGPGLVDHPGMFERCDLSQDLDQVPRSQLAGSAAGGNQRRQSDLVHDPSN